MDTCGGKKQMENKPLLWDSIALRALSYKMAKQEFEIVFL